MLPLRQHNNILFQALSTNRYDFEETKVEITIRIFFYLILSRSKDSVQQNVNKIQNPSY